MRTKKTVFVLIAGKAGVGKTTLANYLLMKLGERKGLGVLKLALAAPIKQIATSVFGWDGKKDAKGRRLLQVIGTDCGRAYNEDIWVEKTVDAALTTNIYPPNFVIIDDWRFPNECSYIQDLGVHEVVTIRVEASNREMLKGTDEENHPSEVSLPISLRDFDEYYDFTVDNQLNYENLYCQVDEILSSLEKQFILE